MTAGQSKFWMGKCINIFQKYFLYTCVGFPNSLNVFKFLCTTIRICCTYPSNFFHPDSRIALVYQLFCSHTRADRFEYDGIAKKKLDGYV